MFQGVEGAYSYGAMRAYFKENIKNYHVKTFKDAMEEVSEGRADYAVLPIENSTAGIVADIYDLLMEYQLYIAGEQIIRRGACACWDCPNATAGRYTDAYIHTHRDLPSVRHF